MNLFRRMRQKFALEGRNVMCALVPNKMMVYFSDHSYCVQCRAPTQLHAALLSCAPKCSGSKVSGTHRVSVLLVFHCHP